MTTCPCPAAVLLDQEPDLLDPYISAPDVASGCGSACPCFLFDRPLTWEEWKAWVLENQPERMGLLPCGGRLTQPRPRGNPEDREANPEGLRKGSE